MTGTVLSLNAGSSSIKFALFDPADGLRETVRGEIEGLGGAPRFTARDAAGTLLADRRLAPGFDGALHVLLDFADGLIDRSGLAVVGHRIVHGGSAHIAPELVTPALLADLEALTPLAPLHMPLNLAPIRAVAAVRPALPQVACFDTAFHHTMPDVATRLALPRAVSDAGVRRYGFHGLSYEYIARQLAQLSPAVAAGHVVAAHLGAGASLCAMAAGVSVETTTGFSALEGLVMATRCGTLDPGVVLYLLRQGRSIDDIEDMLYRRSGLLGVSGISGDMRVLHASADPRAGQAVDLFAYRIACDTAALAGALGGLDGLVFTAGIGEHDPLVRAAVCRRLAWLGVHLDDAANAAGALRISADGSGVEVFVIPTDEEAMIALHAGAFVAR